MESGIAWGTIEFCIYHFDSINLFQFPLGFGLHPGSGVSALEG